LQWKTGRQKLPVQSGLVNNSLVQTSDRLVGLYTIAVCRSRRWPTRV